LLSDTIKIWTRDEGKFLNIVHVHICDLSQDASFDTKYLATPDIDLRKMNFGADAFGRKLRYKVVVYDMKVFAILYDNGSVIERLAFQEISIPAPDTIVTFGKFVGKVSKIPFKICCAFEECYIPSHQESVSHDEMISCHARIFEELPGYITVECISKDNMAHIL
jgi:hypothetical protein